jgi:hypothetical protein
LFGFWLNRVKPIVGRDLDVDEDDVGVAAGRIVVGHAKAFLFAGDALDQVVQARFVAVERGFAAVEAVDLPSRALGAALDAGNGEARRQPTSASNAAQGIPT